MPDHARRFRCGVIPVPFLHVRVSRLASRTAARVEIAEGRRVYHLGDAQAATAAEGPRDAVQDHLPARLGRVSFTAVETQLSGIRALAHALAALHDDPAGHAA